MMSLFFASPAAGLWALLGIPAVLAIHFLQTPSRPVRVSTLFLLEKLEPESTGGRRFERLRQSLPLWLQLFAVLLLAWLLAQPRWLRRDSTQSVLVLLDSSVSMRAFEKPLQEILPSRLRTLAGAAAKTEWLLMETDPAAERLYAGGSLGDLASALRRWRSRLGEHDVQPAFQAGLSLLRGRGTLVFVTDHNAPVPPGVELFAVGQPIENAGFCGVRATADGWDALLRNFGSLPQRRRWHIEDAAGQWLGGEQTVELQPGGSVTIRGGFPAAPGKIRVVMNGDEFPLDDVLPLVRPEPKRVRVHVENSERIGEWLDPFLRSETALDRGDDRADLQFVAGDFSAPPKLQTPSVAFLKEASPKAVLRKGTIVPERDTLTAGLKWDGLMVTGTSSIAREPGDSVLLWMDDRPLILRRGRQLLVGFDIAQSNAARLPAFVLLLHRFVESVRSELAVPETTNFETNQLLEGNHGGSAMRAPSEPGFFENGAEKSRLTGAAHFADSRESDFRSASSADHLETVAKELRERRAEQDALTPLWVLLLGVVIAGSWVKTDERRGR